MMAEQCLWKKGALVDVVDLETMTDWVLVQRVS